MRRKELKLICDLCLDEIEVEESATVRIRLIDEKGSVQALDLCEAHDGDVHPSQVAEHARLYGTPLRAAVDRKGKVTTTVRENRPRRSRAASGPGGDWTGTYAGPCWCLVKSTKGGAPCGQECRNVVGLKTHQAAAHGIRVAR